MASTGSTEFRPNQRWFDTVLRSPGVKALVDGAGEEALGNARANAPVDEGDYLRGLHLEHRDSRYRETVRVVGDDPKTMLIESKTGNLARSLKQVKKR